MTEIMWQPGKKSISNSQMDQFRQDVNDSLVVGQNWQGDERVILFVKMKEGNKLTGELIDKIKKNIRA